MQDYSTCNSAGSHFFPILCLHLLFTKSAVSIVKLNFLQNRQFPKFNWMFYLVCGAPIESLLGNILIALILRISRRPSFNCKLDFEFTKVILRNWQKNVWNFSFLCLSKSTINQSHVIFCQSIIYCWRHSNFIQDWKVLLA